MKPWGDCQAVAAIVFQCVLRVVKNAAETLVQMRDVVASVEGSCRRRPSSCIRACYVCVEEAQLGDFRERKPRHDGPRKFP